MKDSLKNIIMFSLVGGLAFFIVTTTVALSFKWLNYLMSL